MTCGLCKQPIRGDERYTTDHYQCGAELTASFRDDIEKLQSALQRAVQTIRTWHGMGMPADMEREAWALYQASPEMRQINAAIAPARGEAQSATNTPSEDQPGEHS